MPYVFSFRSSPSDFSILYLDIVGLYPDGGVGSFDGASFSVSPNNLYDGASFTYDRVSDRVTMICDDVGLFSRLLPFIIG